VRVLGMVIQRHRVKPRLPLKGFKVRPQLRLADEFPSSSGGQRHDGDDVVDDDDFEEDREPAPAPDKKDTPAKRRKRPLKHS
jgi:hypothetical protein